MASRQKNRFKKFRFLCSETLYKPDFGERLPFLQAIVVFQTTITFNISLPKRRVKAGFPAGPNKFPSRNIQLDLHSSRVKKDTPSNGIPNRLALIRFTSRHRAVAGACGGIPGGVLSQTFVVLTTRI